MEAKVIFSNGSVITAEQNGSCLIVASKPTFPADLTNISIESTEGNSVIENGQIVECASVDGRYWFSIIEIPASQVKEAETETRIAAIEDALCELSEG